MDHIPEQVKRRMISDDLRAHCEATLQDRVDRYIEISHQPITPNPHFAAASAECIRLYTDGYFISTIMVAQSVAEGISRFVAERNDIQFDKKMSGPKIVDLLVVKGIISPEYEDAFKRLWEKRNDVHHMNPSIGGLPFPELAKGSIQDLSAIEREVFDFKMRAGMLIPLNPKYWDITVDGKANIYLRLSP